MRIHIQRSYLTDRSEVFDVVIYDDASSTAAITLHAYSEEDAIALAEKLAAAIDDHTTSYASRS